MADRLYRAQVTIPLDSGVPEDAIVNTFHFDDDDDPLAGAEDTQGWIMDALTAFYQAIDGVIFGQNINGPATVKMYDLRDPEPRVPRATDTITLAPLASGIDLTLPNQVALCASFAAAPVSGLSAARRRGRIYLGPIHYAAAEMVGSHARPTAAARTAVVNAMDTLAAGVEHPGSPGLHLKWSIYSPTTDATASLDDSFNDVVSGWVDNTFDIQRRRAPEATLRTTFS